MDQYILSIDQGTTSSRAILFSASGLPVYTAQQEFQQFFPDDGWVEHDPEEIWSSTLSVVQQVIDHARSEHLFIVALGITNQRETTIVWEKSTGRPIYNAIVWQDRRTAEYCQTLRGTGAEDGVKQKTGLLLDPYFSATKINWILNNVPGARDKAINGELAFGTVDSFLVWRLTNGNVHATDATNASRTLLFNISNQQWDNSLLELFEIPQSMLPEVRDCAADFGTTDKQVTGLNIPIAGIAGDQQAALIGQACFKAGMTKSTYGTGCFMIMNTGDKQLTSTNKLLTTVGYRLNGKTTYAIEGSIFVAGAAVQWLRDGLKIIQDATETEAISQSINSNNNVFMVPAFTGLGAPYWDPDARGAIFGLTRDTGIAEIVRATLESVCYQTADLLHAMENDGSRPTELRVDGGMVNNNWICGFLADILQTTVKRPQVVETTALGAAYLAGLHVGIFESLDSIETHWQLEKEFESTMADTERQNLLSQWHSAVDKVRSN